jgi:hypothetical protein
MLRTLSLIALCASLACAAIGPQFYRRYQEQAPEQLVIRVIDLRKSATPTGGVRIVAHAEVLRVSRTGTKLTKGSNIQIDYVSAEANARRPMMSCAPPPIPMLTKGATTMAFLFRHQTRTSYTPAAAHESFTAIR